MNVGTPHPRDRLRHHVERLDAPIDIQRQETTGHRGKDIVVIIGQCGQLQDFVVELAVTLLKGHAMLAEFAGHVVEIASEDGNLVMRLDGYAMVEIPTRHRHCSLGKYLERCHDTSRQPRCYSDAECDTHHTQQEHLPTRPGDFQMHLMQRQSHAHRAPFL